ncbi:unnamed protein product [Cylicocyclus nassatus]|uniref:Uncharacterized protein n=1 Tax=Cylicocyclus nassatus TaxID=53992 RepID=A0AA36H1Z2_CYLNA|nr:unnamed protein product [Cylicocyclus nassatus]
MVKKSLELGPKKKEKRLKKKLEPVKKEPEVPAAKQSSSKDRKGIQICVAFTFFREVAVVFLFSFAGTVEGFIGQFVPVPISEVVVQRSNAVDGQLWATKVSVRFEDSKGVDIALSKCHDVGPYRVCDFVDSEITRSSKFCSTVSKFVLIT